MHDFDSSSLDRFRQAVNNGSKQDQFEAARELINYRHYMNGIISYEILFKMYPEDQGLCLYKLGQAYMMMGEEEKAIDHFIEAYQTNYDKQLCDDAIWDACERGYSKFREIEFIYQYKRFLPEGDYVRRANDMIENRR